MYEIKRDSFKPASIIYGNFPVTMDFAKVGTGTSITAFTPVMLKDGVAVELTAAGAADFYGITAEQSRGTDVVCYLTGEFFADKIVIPTGFTVDSLKAVCRKANIFLR